MDGIRAVLLPGTRVESGFMGPRARAVRDFRLPRGMRLTLDAEAEVALS